MAGPVGAPRVRTFTLGIWALALGYFASYAPYTTVVRVTSTRLLPGIDNAESHVAMLLAAGVATAIASPLIVTALGWWGYAGRRVILGVRVPWPTPSTLISGLATTLIIYTTTLIYSFRGVSIVLAMLLMRAGVLMLAPIVDAIFHKRVRWFSWAAFGLSLLAMATVVAELSSYQVTWPLALAVGTYIGAYAIRLPCITRLATSDGRDAARRYLVEEQLVAAGALVVAPLALALIGSTGTSLEVRRAVTSFVSSQALGPSLLVGVLYACLYWFGTSIYLDRRENTYCVPLNRCSSVLAVLVSSYAMASLFGSAQPSAGELVGAALLGAAMLVLSPLHHLRVRRIRVEEPVSHGWLVFLRSPRASASVAVNATDR
jgi:hypothetical protein